MPPSPSPRPLRAVVPAAALALATALAPAWAGPPAAAVPAPEAQIETPPPAPAAETPRLDELQEELRRLIGQARDRVFPALVHIHTVTVHYYGGQETKSNAVGSGTLISPEGHVLTNQHVTDNGRSFRCTLSDKQEVPCALVGEDPLTDLAVLRVDRAALDDPEAPLPHAELGDSERLRVGDYVLAMGSPFALSRSVTLGIVSNSERVFAGGPGGADPDEMELEAGQRTGLFTRWIQHDALINPGNSGGPLVDLSGAVVGVNELGGAAMGFAIPSNLARRVAADLVAHGEVPRSWIGVSFRPIDKTGHPEGVLIDSVVAGSPAAGAGIEAGDLLVELAGEPVEARFPEQVPPLMKRIADLPIGSTVEVAVRRGGERRRATLTTERLEKDRGDEAAFRAWGVVAQEITPKMARDRRLDSTAGALVSGVRGGGPAQLAEPPLAEGDVVRRVGDREIATLAELAAFYEELQAARDGAAGELLVGYDRQGKSFLTVLKPRSDQDRDRPLELPKAWIGIATQPVVPRLAERLGDAGAVGYRIARVYPGTEAERAGLAVGDVVVALDGEPLEPRGIEDSGLLARRVRPLPIGGAAALTVLRDGARREVRVTLERTRLSPDEAARHRDPDFELLAREVTFFDRDDQRWDEGVAGVLVEQIEPAGWAGLGGVRPGDLILRFGGRPVADLAGFERALAAAVEGRAERVEVVVLRGARTHFLYLEPEWSPLPEDGGGGEEGGDA